MAITPELDRRLNNPGTRDEAMLEIARHYIDAPGIKTDELVHLMVKIPFLNDRDQAGVDEILLRVQRANELLPQAVYIFSLGAKFSGVPEKVEEQTDLPFAFSLCYGGVAQAEKLAATMNTPVRETPAALARIGVQMAVHFIITTERPEIKSLTKTHMVYFSLIEMLALGTITNAFQYCHTGLEETSLDFFKHIENILPTITLRPGKDTRKFKGSVAFGETRIEHLVVPEKGKEFYYLGGSDNPPPSHP